MSNQKKLQQALQARKGYEETKRQLLAGPPMPQVVASSSVDDTYESVHNWAPVRIDIQNAVILWICTDKPCEAISMTLSGGDAKHTPAKGGVCPAMYNHRGKQQLVKVYVDGEVVNSYG